VRETEAVFWILARIVDGEDQLAWSTVLDLENSHHPLVDLLRRARRGSMTLSVVTLIEYKEGAGPWQNL
jgi:hypothetical protein